ncbi:MAG: hypothetical protein ACLQVJ_30245, partial [Syntrophobacteraceae bacterium]
LLKKVPGPFSASFLFFTRNNRQIMPQIIPESKIYFVTYRGEMCELSQSLHWRLLKGFVSYSAS